MSYNTLIIITFKSIRCYVTCSVILCIINQPINNFHTKIHIGSLHRNKMNKEQQAMSLARLHNKTDIHDSSV